MDVKCHMHAPMDVQDDVDALDEDLPLDVGVHVNVVGCYKPAPLDDVG